MKSHVAEVLNPQADACLERLAPVSVEAPRSVGLFRRDYPTPERRVSPIWVDLQQTESGGTWRVGLRLVRRISTPA